MTSFVHTSFLPWLVPIKPRQCPALMSLAESIENVFNAAAKSEDELLGFQIRKVFQQG
jgi:hypothetical protein